MALNLRPWMERISIQNKETLRVERLSLDPSISEFAWAQGALVDEIERQYNAGLPVRIIVLKARQIGLSTVSEGVIFNWAFIHEGIQSLVIAHETPASKNLFSKAKLMWETWPLRPLYTESHNSQKSLGWEETRSNMQVATARNTGSGRSFTYHAVHASECGFWDDPEELMTGLNESIPFEHGTIVIYESTANGVGGWFYDEWNAAVEGNTSFVPMFFAWHKHPPYTIDNTTLTPADYRVEETALAEQFSLTPGQIAWRRRKIADKQGDIKSFQQEYPFTPEEAFLVTGRNVLPLNVLEQVYEKRYGVQGYLYDSGRIQFKEDATGPLTIFEYPSDNKAWGTYVIAGDPSRTAYGDGACIQVLNRKTFEQVAVYHSHIDPIPFAHDLMRLAYYYNTGLLNVETNGPGYGTIAVVLEHSYPDVWRFRRLYNAPGRPTQSYGWDMSRQLKHAATGWLINIISQHAQHREHWGGPGMIHDEKTYHELRNFVYLDGGELGPASPQGNDDSVTSLLIAIGSTMFNDKQEYGPGPDPQNNDLFDIPPWEAFQ